VDEQFVLSILEGPMSTTLRTIDINLNIFANDKARLLMAKVEDAAKKLA